ncbi:MAG TPA: hypothetical protein V6D11_30585 [Waterburya sp.]|jgi:hypothetical protein
MNSDKAQTSEHTNDGVGRLNKLAYRDGYIHGREVEHHIQEENRVIRENDSAASGLLMGITITVLAGLLGGTIFVLTHFNQRSTSPRQPNPAPNTSQLQTPHTHAFPV